VVAVVVVVEVVVEMIIIISITLISIYLLGDLHQPRLSVRLGSVRGR
jgi:hypothetical protein